MRSLGRKSASRAVGGILARGHTTQGAEQWNRESPVGDFAILMILHTVHCWRTLYYSTSTYGHALEGSASDSLQVSRGRDRLLESWERLVTVVTLGHTSRF